MPETKMLQLGRGIDTYHMVSHEGELGESLEISWHYRE